MLVLLLCDLLGSVINRILAPENFSEPWLSWDETVMVFTDLHQYHALWELKLIFFGGGVPWLFEQTSPGRTQKTTKQPFRN